MKNTALGSMMSEAQFPLRELAAIGIVLCLAIGIAFPQPAQAQVDLEIEEAPFFYSETPPNNRVSRLVEQIKDGTVKLEYSDQNGYLKSLLKALEIPESSQTLVFSKTSMQVRYISRRNPRAIYFNDDTYVGWVRGSTLMEISTADPKLGAAFYTVDMMPWRAKIEQAYYDCLACHATSMTRGVPGHTIRSIYPEVDGSVATQMDSFVTDHTSPFSHRWGGWYVTGRHGDMTHMGNTFLRGGELDTRDNGNRLSLWDEFDTRDYLLPYSDITALMVLEHQAQMHNQMTVSDFQIRKLVHEREAPADRSSEEPSEFSAQIELAAREILRCLLFSEEAELTSKVQGSVIFADDFVRNGPTDSKGRSLRDLNLETRLFEYPCSYLIYSPAFDALQPPLRRSVYRQLIQVLTAKTPAEPYRHLDQPTRTAILEILSETKPELDVIRRQIDLAASDQPDIASPAISAGTAAQPVEIE